MPFFNAFMIPFMKDKPREKFYETPPMPVDIKALVEQRKREELEKLEKADEEGRSLGVNYNPPPIRIHRETTRTTDESDTSNTGITNPNNATPDTDVPPPVTPRLNTPENLSKPTPKPPVETAPKEEPKPRDEGTKKKGKKGDEDN